MGSKNSWKVSNSSGFIIRATFKESYSGIDKPDKIGERRLSNYPTGGYYKNPYIQNIKRVPNPSMAMVIKTNRNRKRGRGGRWGGGGRKMEERRKVGRRKRRKKRDKSRDRTQSTIQLTEFGLMERKQSDQRVGHI